LEAIREELEKMRGYKSILNSFSFCFQDPSLVFLITILTVVIGCADGSESKTSDPKANIEVKDPPQTDDDLLSGSNALRGGDIYYSDRMTEVMPEECAAIKIEYRDSEGNRVPAPQRIENDLYFFAIDSEIYSDSECKESTREVFIEKGKEEGKFWFRAESPTLVELSTKQQAYVKVNGGYVKLPNEEVSVATNECLEITFHHFDYHSDQIVPAYKTTELDTFFIGFGASFYSDNGCKERSEATFVVEKGQKQAKIWFKSEFENIFTLDRHLFDEERDRFKIVVEDSSN